MRRVVTALVLVSVAAALVACSSGSPTTTTGTPVPAAGGTVVVAPAPPANTTGDILSPLPVSTPVQAFPTDPASVPKVVLDTLAAHKPMLVFFFDPTTHVSDDQRDEINVVMKKYAGAIQLFSFDYTSGIPVGSTTATLPVEIDKAERMIGLLKISTTPYIVFVNASGQITFRFAGFVDSGLLEREVMRATQ